MKRITDNGTMVQWYELTVVRLWLFMSFRLVLRPELTGKLLVVLPPFFYAVIQWPADGVSITPADKEQLKTTCRLPLHH